MSKRLPFVPGQSYTLDELCGQLKAHAENLDACGLNHAADWMRAAAFHCLSVMAERDRAVATAVAAEREACAQFAEDVFNTTSFGMGRHQAGEAVAKGIRGRT